MLRSLSSRRGHRGCVCHFVVALALAGVPLETQAAVVFDLVLTGASELVPTVGVPEPLSGTLRIEIDDPSAVVPTSIRVLDLDVTGGGLMAMLDETVLSPGIGVLFPDASFLVPTLFLVLDAGAGAFALAIPDVEGTAQLDEQSELLLETSFAIDADDPAGVVSVNIVAVPEPSGGLLACCALLLLAGIRLSIQGVGSSDRGAGSRGGRGRVRESDT